MNTAVINTFANMSKIDAALRGAVALALLAVVLGLNLEPLTSFALVLLSIPTMLFALMRWDPVYSLLGLNSGNRLKA